jgi:transposase
MPACKGRRLNCFAMISRQNDCLATVTTERIDADFIIRQLDELSMSIRKPTVVVLDNAPVHTARKVLCRIPCWQERDLFLFYLPRYSPHLNIAETLWRMVKYFWLRPQDYLSFESLRYAVSLALAAVGSQLFINFSDFSLM